MINKRKGFMISELVIGLVFLIMFIFINITLYINSSKNNIESRRFVQATNLLIKKIEEIQAMDFDDLDIEDINSEEDPLLNEEITIGTSKFQIIVEGREVDNPEDDSLSFTTTEYETREIIVESEEEGEDPVITYVTYERTIHYKPIAKIFTVSVIYGPNENQQVYSISTLKMLESENIFSASNIDYVDEEIYDPPSE